MCNGLSNWKFDDVLSSKEMENFDEETKQKIFAFVDNRLGRASSKELYELKFKVIDTTTEKILKSYGYPVDLLTLVGKVIPRKILNDPIDDLNDIKNQRIRMAEAISHAAYKQLQMSISTFKSQKKLKDARINIVPRYIMNELLGSGMLQYTRTINPLEEINLSAKITKAGIGNMKKEQITLEKRDLNESQFGTISPVNTNEYGGIGINQTLTNKATIKDRFGTILKKEFTNESNPFGNLSALESLTPFYEYDDTTRRVMGNQQTGQFVQIDNPDVPLVQTGFESIIPHIVSDRFAIKAKKDGKVEIKGDFIIMHYKDGTEEIFSLKPAKARTKRGAYLPLEYNKLVQNNEQVKANQIIAVTNSLKHGKLAIGKNLVVAEMSYRGMNFEDGWVISEDLNEKFQSKIYEKLTIIVPEKSTVLKLNISKDLETKPGDVLIEYTLDVEDLSNIENIEEKINESADENDKANDIGVGKEIVGHTIRYRSIGGKIADYVIKLNTPNVDSSIYKKYVTQKKEINNLLEKCKKLRSKEAQLDCKNNIEHIESLEIGGHKIAGNEIEGAIIEIYIEKENPIRYGSKFTLGNSGGKGTVQYVIPKDKKPKALESGLEIDFVATPMSLISRKNPSILLSLYTGKVAYFLNKDMETLILNNKIPEAKKLITAVFSALDNSQDQYMVKAIDAFFKNKPDYIKKYVKQHHPLNNPAFPIIVPPYKNKISIPEIERAAKILKVPLNEKVYVPEEDTTTEFEITVGIMPVYLLEHFPKEMSSVRGIINVKRQISTGQGSSGTKEGNGAIRLGLYDLFSVASRDSKDLLKELWLLKADTRTSKNKLIRDIVKGNVPSLNEIEVPEDDQLTKKMIEAYFYGAILEPQL